MIYISKITYNSVYILLKKYERHVLNADVNKNALAIIVLTAIYFIYRKIFIVKLFDKYFIQVPD